MADKAKVYKLDQYRKDAKIKDFVLEIGEDEEIVIVPPSGEALLQLAETPLSQTRKIMALICGDQWSRIYDVVGGESYEVFQRLVIDLVDHFKINQGQMLPGGGEAAPPFESS